MPCFLVGYTHAKLLSDALGVPLVEVSHQQGHVAASLWSAGAMDLMDQPHLAWHLSGGTTELLLVEPDGRNVKCTRIGGIFNPCGRKNFSLLPQNPGNAFFLIAYVQPAV